MTKRDLIIGCVATIAITTLHITHSPTVFSTNSWQVTHTQTFETRANTNEELSENVLKIVEDKEKVPRECIKRRFGITCNQETSIKVEVVSTWTITEANPIDSTTLTSQEFAENYPDIQEANLITNDSSEEDKLVAQRILYERGLLLIPPTGFLGHLTQMGIARLQHIKFIYDEVGRIGPNTIEELNALKNRMQKDEYLENSPLPPLNLDIFFPPLREIYEDNASKVEMIKGNPGFYKSAEITTPFDESVVPFMNYFGEIKILPQEE